MIKVKFFGTLQTLLKLKEISVPYTDNMNVNELLNTLQQMIKFDFISKLINQDQSIKPGVIILVNKQNIFHLNLLDTQLADNDEVVIFPPGAGG